MRVIDEQAGVAGWEKGTTRSSRKKKSSLREGKDMGDYLLTNISKLGIISGRFLSFFPISPEARQAEAAPCRLQPRP